MHRARTKDGHDVAVKLQHLLVERFSNIDLEITDFTVHAVKRFFPNFEFVWLSEEMKKNLPKELDFCTEYENSSKLLKLFPSDRTLKVPKTFFVTKKIHCMEFIEGEKVDNHEYLKKNNINPYAVVDEITRIFSDMIFTHGYVHCDPHSGNILIMCDENSFKGFKVVLLDHGLYRAYDEDFRVNYAKLWVAMFTGSIDDIKKYSKALGGGDAYKLFTSILTARSWEIIEKNAFTNVRTKQEEALMKNNAGAYIPEITQLLDRIPRPLLLLLKTNDLLRSLNFKLCRKDVTSSTVVRQMIDCRRAIFQYDIKSCGVVQSFFERLKYYFSSFILKILLFSLTLNQ